MHHVVSVIWDDCSDVLLSSGISDGSSYVLVGKIVWYINPPWIDVIGGET
jgi:hypothetical protein